MSRRRKSRGYRKVSAPKKARGGASAYRYGTVAHLVSWADFVTAVRCGEASGLSREESVRRVVLRALKREEL